MSNARCGISWATNSGHGGYFVTTVGRDEEVIRAYIRNQEPADRQLEQFELIQQPKIQSIVQTSFKTAFGGSQSNLQLCWRLLAANARSTRPWKFSNPGEELPDDFATISPLTVLCT